MYGSLRGVVEGRGGAGIVETPGEEGVEMMMLGVEPRMKE